MAQPTIQYGFVSGELAPSLYARVDLKQYGFGAALLRNWYVDYRGGVTKSPGTKYILQTINSSTAVRVIPFQASFTVNYVLVFENLKLWFINNGTPVLETTINITGITRANPGVVSAVNSYTNGDRVYISGVAGMTQVNGNYYTVAGRTAGSFQLADLSGNLINTSTYSTYTSGGTAQRIYALASPYAAADLAQIKYTQDVNVMVLCHPNFAPYSLTLTSATSWALAAITIGSTVSAPTGQSVGNDGVTAGSWHYAYVITAVDLNGQESGPSAFATMGPIGDIRTVPGTFTVTWSLVTGAVSYNVYKAEQRFANAVPAGSMFGYIGNCTSNVFVDSNIAPDFSINYPIVKNPFSGSSVQSIAVTNQGSYSNTQFIPTVSFSGGGGSGAQAIATAQVISVAIVSGGALGISAYAVNDLIYFANGVTLRVTSINGASFGPLTGVALVSAGSLNSGGVTPANGTSQTSTSGFGTGATFTFTWGVVSVAIVASGAGYGSPPTVVFSGGAAAATATIGAPAAGNPTVPGFYQQRLVLAGPTSNPRQVNMSQPGTYYNFNQSNPILPSDAFQGFLTSGKLNTIQSMVPMPQGLAVLSDQSAWLINGGSQGSAADATNLVANPQVFSGAGALMPLLAGPDILYVQSKGSIVRNAVFNWEKQVITGVDITILSNHLFTGFTLVDSCWAEEPNRIAWYVRNDGQLLSVTYSKEQELIGWTHRDTSGSFKSVCSVVETGTALGSVDVVYAVVQRTINGSTVQYIERFMEQYYPSGATDAWQVDAGLQYNGAAALSFTNAMHLLNTDITGLATDDTGDVTVFTATVSSTGTFSISAPTSPATGYTRVTAGIAQPSAQLTTLGIDIRNEPTVQGKMKLLPAVTVRVKDTLGLEIGTDYDNLVDMEDLIIGNVGKDTNEVVTTAMVTGDALQTLDPKWQVPGQYCIQSSDPWPATILGLIPQITVGDTKSERST